VVHARCPRAAAKARLRLVPGRSCRARTGGARTPPTLDGGTNGTAGTSTRSTARRPCRGSAPAAGLSFRPAVHVAVAAPAEPLRLPPPRPRPPPARTSVWLISSSVALKKCGATSGPIRKVTRLCATGTVNASPNLAYPSSISFQGPCAGAAQVGKWGENARVHAPRRVAIQWVRGERARGWRCGATGVGGARARQRAHPGELEQAADERHALQDRRLLAG
jgi:hypothetical protein